MTMPRPPRDNMRVVLTVVFIVLVVLTLVLTIISAPNAADIERREATHPVRTFTVTVTEVVLR